MNTSAPPPHVLDDPELRAAFDAVVASKRVAVANGLRVKALNERIRVLEVEREGIGEREGVGDGENSATRDLWRLLSARAWSVAAEEDPAT